MAEKSSSTTIYVYLLVEGTDVWRPVDAIYLEEGVYQISPETVIPETEIWEFLPGDTVRCEEKRLSKGKSLVAVEKVKASTTNKESNNTPEKRIYEPVPKLTHEEVDSAIQNDDVDSLIKIAFAVGYYADDWKYAQDICIQLSEHPNKTVRGNALLGLSYVAMFRRQLDKRLVKPILLRGLRDAEEEVRERAEDAISEINWAMKWKIGRYHKKEKTIGIEENEELPLSKRRS